MAINLFVGGLPYETSQDELAKIFAGCGKVTNVKLIMDRETGRSKGFGFVEMADAAEAQAAILKLNGTALGERQLFVSEARPQEKRPGVSADKPGFVERRSGVKDRRRQPEPGAAPERREGFTPEKKWGPGGPGGGNKWGGKRKKFGSGFGGGKSGGRPK